MPFIFRQTLLMGWGADVLCKGTAYLKVALVALGMIVLSFASNSFAFRYHKLGSSLDIHIDPKLRMAYTLSKNTGDLQSASEDGMAYWSYIYNIPIQIDYSGVTFFANVVSEGPSHYAAPLRTLFPRIEGSVIEKNAGIRSAFFPGVDQLWLKFSPVSSLELQLGQAPYTVGGKYALGGQYNNYGVTVSTNLSDNVTGRFRYSYLDLENRLYSLRGGGRTKFGLGKAYTSRAYMLATDLKIKLGHHIIQPYVGMLFDNTGPVHRTQSTFFSNGSTNRFVARNDRIGTVGLYLKFDFPRITIEGEGAQNFGSSDAATTNGWTDLSRIRHRGYLYNLSVKSHLGIASPRAKVVIASGNRVSPNDPAISTAGTRRFPTNYAFTVFSPLNSGLVDSFAHLAPVPIVAMAGGYTMNYGIRRPGTFNDPHVWENIIAYNIGMDLMPVDGSYIGIDLWKLRAKEAGIGQNSAGIWRHLSKDLGYEADIYASYALMKYLTIGTHGGYFWPGNYYKEVRYDPSNLWNGNASQTVGTASGLQSATGAVDPAYQIELFTEVKF